MRHPDILPDCPPLSVGDKRERYTNPIVPVYLEPGLDISRNNPDTSRRAPVKRAARLPVCHWLGRRGRDGDYYILGRATTLEGARRVLKRSHMGPYAHLAMSRLLHARGPLAWVATA